MTRNAEAVLTRVMGFEGAVADVGDGQGITRWGQTPGWLTTYDFPIPTTAADAMVNYEKWLKRTQLDQVCDRDATLGLQVVDFAVHSGVVAAVKALQRALHVSADGAIGPETLGALATADVRLMAHAVLANRLRYVARALSADPSRRQFAAGWMNRFADLTDALGAAW